MKRGLLVVITICFLNSSCLRVDDRTQESLTNFPDRFEKIGNQFAQYLRTAVSNMNALGVDYGDYEVNADFRKMFYLDFARANGNLMKDKTSGDALGSFDEDEMVDILLNLTPVQISYLSKILNACGSYVDHEKFMAYLLKLNEEILENVPEIEQERLLYTNSLLYYGIKEIARLEEHGQMFRTPNSDLRLIMGQQSQTETRFAPAIPFVVICKYLIAMAGAYALGSALADGVVTAIDKNAGMFLWEYTVCRSEWKEELPILPLEFCINMYVACVERYWMHPCSDCLHYCRAQGRWPQLCPMKYPWE